jgi:hypothetical protein
MLARLLGIPSTVLSVCFASAGAWGADIALVGGTVVDVADYGNSAHDLHDATVLIHDRLIVAVGARGSVNVPPNARVIDATGQFLIPGLIDGFAAQRSAGQAKAHLAMGVTTIIGLSDDRRGLLMDFDPEPHIRRLDAVTGYDQSHLDPPPDTIGELRARARRLSASELAAYVDAKAWDGYEVLLLMYPLDLEQVRAVVAAARRHGIATIGELGHASYVDAARAGVQAFVHLNRIASELAPRELRREIADHPFPANSGPLRRRFETFLAGLGPDQAEVRAYAEALGRTPVALMPTTALFVAGTELDPRNPWASEIGPLVDPHDVHLPLDRATGAAPPSPGLPADVLPLMTRAAEHLLALQSAFIAAGSHYLAGSGTTAFGVLPGDGLHWELKLLTRLGLTPRQALAAATSNYGAVFGWTDRGAIAAGRRADLVLLREDPTAEVGNSRAIARVFLDGRELNRSELLRVAR